MRRANPDRPEPVSTHDLEFFPTPAYLCELLYDRFFGYLTSSDVVIEPAAGQGHFLSVIPQHIAALGIELSPERAAIARANTGRNVIVGDFLTIPLEVKPNAIISNPPFSMVRAFLARAEKLLVDGGACGFLMPTHLLSYSRAVAKLSDQWSIQTELIPRDVFEEETKFSVCFSVFTKDRKRGLIGLAGFLEAADVKNLDPRFSRILRRETAPKLWRDVVTEALRILGGKASLGQIYRLIQGYGESRSHHWKEKIRQTCQLYCTRVDSGVYALPETAAA